MLLEWLCSLSYLTARQVFFYPAVFVEDFIIEFVFIQFVYVVRFLFPDKMPAIRIQGELF